MTAPSVTNGKPDATLTGKTLPPGGGPIYDQLTAPRKNFRDLGLVRVAYTYQEKGILYTRTPVLTADAHEAILNLLEGEEIG